jgi:hypothetical protein
MTSEKKNEIGADDSNGRVRKIRKAAALALKESDQLRLAHRCVLRIRGVGRITAPDSIFSARENRCPSHAQSDRKNRRQVNISYTNYMKSPLCSSLLKAALLIVLLALCFGSSTYGQARDRNVLSPGPVRPGNLDYRTELPQGYLKVYSESNEFNDGAYYAHSSYAIYSIDGRLFKRVENNISRTDETIPWEVALPAGSYTVVARSTRDGEVRVRFVIKAGRRTIVDLDLAEKETYRRLLQTSDRVASSNDS